MITGDRIGGWGDVLEITVRMENRGDAAVHLLTDLLQVTGEGGTRGTVREFRDRYRLHLARTGDDARRREFQAAMAATGIDGDDARQMSVAQIEVQPEQARQQRLFFLLRNDVGDTRYVMDFSYHDDATDRIVRSTLPVRSRGIR